MQLLLWCSLHQSTARGQLSQNAKCLGAIYSLHTNTNTWKCTNTYHKWRNYIHKKMALFVYRHFWTITHVSHFQTHVLTPNTLTHESSKQWYSFLSRHSTSRSFTTCTYIHTTRPAPSLSHTHTHTHKQKLCKQLTIHMHTHTHTFRGTATHNLHINTYTRIIYM